MMEGGPWPSLLSLSSLSLPISFLRSLTDPFSQASSPYNSTTAKGSSESSILTAPCPHRKVDTPQRPHLENPQADI